VGIQQDSCQVDVSEYEIHGWTLTPEVQDGLSIACGAFVIEVPDMGIHVL
jgi:hypothetical protein